MTIGEIIRMLRTRFGLDQNMLAGKAGISIPYLSLIETGRREPSLAVLVSLSKGLGVPMTMIWFLTEKANDFLGLDAQLYNAISAAVLEFLKEEQNG